MPAAPTLCMVTLVAVLITLTRIGDPDASSAAAAASAPAPVVVVEPVPSTAPAPYSLDELLAALRLVETGGLKNEGRHATGDGGKAIGPYQIHRSYWKDAGLSGTHEDCRDPGYAREVVMAYWRRYCPKELANGDVETLARVHNGGPEGHKKPATLKFWNKVEAQLRKARSKPTPAPRPKSKPEFC